MSYIKSQKRVISQAQHVVSLVKLDMQLHGVKAACTRLVNLQSEFENWCKENVTKVNWHAIAYTLNQAKVRRSKADLLKGLDETEAELSRLFKLASN